MQLLLFVFSIVEKSKSLKPTQICLKRREIMYSKTQLNIFCNLWGVKYIFVLLVNVKHAKKTVQPGTKAFFK